MSKVLWYYNLIPDVSEAVQKIVCPFHDDVNPSMRIDIVENRFYCFGCNSHGDAKDFVYMMDRKYKNCNNELQSYKNYLNILKSRKASDIKVSRTIKIKKKSSSKHLYNVAYDYYHGLSKIDWNNSDIDEVISTREYMLNRGFTSDTLNKVKAKITYNNQYAIIFPMLDNNKFKGWVCRTTNKDIEKKRKYLYNEGFSRATTLVGNYGSKDYVIVVEGYMDRLKFLQYGEENVVAILGWKMSQQQIQKLKDRGVKNVISALDNDECGRNGTAFLKTVFNVTRWCYIKGIKDPGDMNKETFDKMYKKTMNKYNGV